MRRRQLLMAGAAAPVAGLAGAQTATPAPHMVWPSIALLGGGTLDPAFWQGQDVVLVFWATWCPYCKRHNAHVDKLHRTARGRPLRVLGVAVNSPADAVRRYMADNGFSFPVTLDDGGLRQQLSPRRTLPMTCLLDGGGRLRQAIPGEMSEDDVLALARPPRRPAA